MSVEYQYSLPSSTMTNAAFAEVVQGMPGLLPAMVEHLVQMAPDLTDEERATTIATLKPVSDDIVKLEGEQNEILEDGQKAMAALKKKELPKVKTAMEDSERANAERVLDDGLSTN